MASNINIAGDCLRICLGNIMANIILEYLDSGERVETHTQNATSFGYKIATESRYNHTRYTH